MQARLGTDCRSVLEPGCGSGRIVEALARRGLDATTLSVSRATEQVDVHDARLRQQSRIEFVAGDRAGEILEEMHELTRR
jgi:cyclopropane fatty-acyl-phospholipid synthase-like methyltransferase